MPKESAIGHLDTVDKWLIIQHCSNQNDGFRTV